MQGHPSRHVLHKPRLIRLPNARRVQTKGKNKTVELAFSIPISDARYKDALIRVRLHMSARFTHMQQTVCRKKMQDFSVEGKYHLVPPKCMYG
jgi:hypothetical protein